MRATLLLVLFAACATKTPLVPLLHLAADSRKTAEEAAKAVEAAGIPVRLAKIAELSEVPAWIDSREGWVMLGRAADRERAEQALAAWFAKLKASAATPRPRPEAVTLGARRALDAQQVQTIRSELAKRRDLDQAVRKDPRRKGEAAKVDADNTRYLRGLVTDIGWIDVARFGRAAANAAFLLVQHSGDLPLMLAALPEIEKEVRDGVGDPQTYALLHDRTQLFSGGKQRYGTQVRETDDGRLVVFRLEDPDRVDEFRKALGLRPLRDYLAGFDRAVEIERQQGRG